MKTKIFLLSAVITSIFTVAFSNASFSQTDPVVDPVGGSGPVQGYKSTFNGTWMCHCPTYQQFDCYCAG